MTKLNEKTYLNCIQEAYPQLIIQSARLHNFTDGQFNAILFVNEETTSEAIVFRFPRVESALRDMPGEVRLLTALQGHTTLPVPNPIFVSSDMQTMGRVFMGYPMLPGKPLWEETVHAIQDEEKLDRIATQLAAFLKALHQLDTKAIGLALELEDPRQSWSEMHANFRDHLFPHMRKDACDWVNQNFESFLSNPANFEYEPVLRHTDFGGSNILFDSETCSVTAVIDWAGITLGDPAVDVAAILHMGEPFFKRMLKTYPEMEMMRPRTRFFQSTYILQEALNALRDDDQALFTTAIAEYQ
jgi:aminoglycoside 2''-phosphotransferase